MASLCLVSSDAPPKAWALGGIRLVGRSCSLLFNDFLCLFGFSRAARFFTYF